MEDLILVYVVWNNYQTSQYCYRCMQDFIYRVDKVDRHHKKAYYALRTKEQLDLLIRLAGSERRVKEVVDDE